MLPTAKQSHQVVVVFCHPSVYRYFILYASGDGFEYLYQTPTTSVTSWAKCSTGVAPDVSIEINVLDLCLCKMMKVTEEWFYVIHTICHQHLPENKCGLAPFRLWFLPHPNSEEKDHKVTERFVRTCSTPFQNTHFYMLHGPYAWIHKISQCGNSLQMKICQGYVNGFVVYSLALFSSQLINLNNLWWVL